MASLHLESARNKDEGGSAAAEVNDARAMKGGGSGGGGEHRMRETARSLATVLRIKVQLTGEIEEKTVQDRKNVKFLQQNSPRPEIKRPPPSFCCAPLFTKSSSLAFRLFA